jgi:recombinational DNA repair protein (RecF pathway)
MLSTKPFTKPTQYLSLLCLSLACFACSTPVSKFGVYQQSDGAVGVHAPKDAKESEAQELATAECQQLGRGTARIAESRKTVNDRFPLTYIYLCR